MLTMDVDQQTCNLFQPSGSDCFVIDLTDASGRRDLLGYNQNSVLQKIHFQLSKTLLLFRFIHSKNQFHIGGIRPLPYHVPGCLAP